MIPTVPVVPGRIVFVHSPDEPNGEWTKAPTGEVSLLDVQTDERIPVGYRVKVDGFRTRDHYTPLGPVGRVGGDLPTYDEALEAVRSRAARPSRILQAIAGRLVATSTPTCPGCGVNHSIDVVRVEGVVPTACSKCGTMTTWRVAA